MPICLYKKRGETPLEALDRLRVLRLNLRTETLSYAGRLDPMAEGLMLVLVGKKENREREKYLGLDKTYEVEILLGIATDTGDALGMVEKVNSKEVKSNKELIEKELQKFVRTFKQPYPKYSSKSISNNFEETSLEPKEVTIYNIEVKGWRELDSRKLLEEILSDIDKVKGDFRQQAIKARWNEALTLELGAYSLVKIKVSCSSGTYMRSLAHNLGQCLDIPSLAYRINRLQIGEYCDTISG